MGIRLLESINAEGNDVAERVDEGAALNFLSTYKKDGRVWGASFVIINSNILKIAPGLLSARGYRLSIDETSIVLNWSSSSMPSADTDYSIYLTIVRSGHNATYSFTTAKAGSDAIDQQEGTFSLLLGTLTAGPSGMVSFTDKLATINPSTSSSGSLGSTIPAPRLAIVGDRKSGGGNYFGYLCLANLVDYTGLSTKYTVTFKLMRYVSHGQYRQRSGTTKNYFHKTGFVQAESNVGWGVETSKLKKEIAISDLKKVTIATNGALTYTRSDAIDSIQNIVGATFYSGPGSSKTAVTTTTATSLIRSVRSKSPILASEAGNYGMHAKHNFMIFGYIAIVKDGSNTVARSALGSTVEIFPNYTNKESTVGLEKKFVIKIGTP